MFSTHFSLLRWVAAALVVVSAAEALGAPILAEFMADNQTTLVDEDGDFTDWIEVHNPDSAPLGLGGFHLTDDAARLTKWTFPAVTLEPGGSLIVFASGKARSDPVGRLHASFQLSADGEFLGLVAPDGRTVVSAFAPSYPPQFADVSFGLGRPGDAGKVVLTPSWSFPDNYANVYVTGSRLANENGRADSLDLGTNDSGSQAYLWFDFSSRLGQLPPGVSIQAAMLSWRGKASSTLIGVPTRDSLIGIFPAPDGRHGVETVAAAFSGHDVVDYYATQVAAAAFNAMRGQTSVATWNLTALVQQWIDQPEMPQRGQILLLNASRPMFMDWETDAAGRPALTLDVALVSQAHAPLSWNYFAKPTPGAANAGGERAGPFFFEVVPKPPLPITGPLIVTAAVRAVNARVRGVQLFYRRMFAAETGLAMTDDGQGSDEVAGDDIWSAVIPRAAFGPGEMTRWRMVAVDAAGTETRAPAYRDPSDSGQYFGTVAEDVGLVTRLPVFHWFANNPGAAGSSTGSRGAVYFWGEFYDNVLFRLHGQSSAGFPKKSYNIDFNRTQPFRWSTNALRVADIDLLTNWGDKSKVRHVLAYEIMREAGVAAHFASTVRVQQNGRFFSTADLVEDADETYLRRAGLNEDGALYKVYANLLSKAAGNTATAGVEKKTRLFEDNRDLQGLIDGLHLNGTALVQFLYDHIDLPRCVNMLAANSVIRNIDLHAKNWYAYRDTGRSDTWAILPWDLDLSHGRMWDTENTYFDNALHTDGYVVTGTSIRLVARLFENPAIRSMILRRVRTLTDRFLQPPPDGTKPENELYYERRLNELSALIDPPAITPSDARLDFEKWGSWLQRGQVVSSTHANAAVETMAEAIGRWKTEYLPGRRRHIYHTQVVGRGGEIPLAQLDRPSIQFGAIEFNPVSGNQDQEFVQLLNPNTFAVDLSGWRMVGGIEHIFAPGTVIPPRGALYTCPTVAAFRARATSPKGGEGRFVQGGYRGHLSNRGETLWLLDHASNAVATVTYGGTPSEAQRYLVISEVMYHPTGDGRSEFVELLNLSATVTLDLNQVRLTQGVEFSFTGSAVTSLAPGARVLVVRDRAAFEATYGTGHPIAGVFANGSALRNEGETITLEDALDGTVHALTYAPSSPWPTRAAGGGHSLVLIAPETKPDPKDAANWRLSAKIGGSPGGSDLVPYPLEPTGDADGNGQPDLLDHAFGNDLGLPALAPAFVLEPASEEHPAALRFSYPISLGAERVRIEVLLSTNLRDWREGTDDFAESTLRPLGDGRAWVDRRFKAAVLREPRVFVRLRAVPR